MAFEETLAARLRAVMADQDEVSERRVFGGLTFLLGEHMRCGVPGDELVLRLGRDRATEALAAPQVRPMDLTGRPLRGFVTVRPEGLAGDAPRRWVELALEFAAGLPLKSLTHASLPLTPFMWL